MNANGYEQGSGIDELQLEIPACKYCYDKVLSAFEDQYRERTGNLKITLSFRSAPERQIHIKGCTAQPILKKV